MNLFIKSYRVVLFFFALIACESCFNSGIAQVYTLRSVPFFQTIELPSLYHEIPNETFFAGRSGTLFIGKKNGLSIHTPEESYHLFMEGPVHVHGEGEDTLVYAAVNDMGFLVRDKRGRWFARSLQNRIPDSYRHFVPFHLLCHQERAYMLGSTGLLTMHKGRITPLPSGMDLSNMYVVRDTLYLRTLQGDYLELRESAPVLTEKPPLVIPRNHPKERFLDFLPSGEMLFTGEGDELVLRDTGKSELLRLGPQENISAAELKQVRADRDWIWILQGHSLTRVMYPSYLRILKIPENCPGQLITSCVSGSELYLAGSGGLCKVNLAQGNGRFRMEKLTGPADGRFHILARDSSRLFAGGGKSLLAIRDGVKEQIAEGPVTGLVATGEGEVLAGLPAGVYRFTLPEGQWRSHRLEQTLPGAHNFRKSGNEIFFISGPAVYSYETGSGKISEFQIPGELPPHRLSRGEHALYALSGRSLSILNEETRQFEDPPDTYETRIMTVSTLTCCPGDGQYWMLHEHPHRPADVIRAKVGASGTSTRHFPVLGSYGEILDMDVWEGNMLLTTRDRILVIEMQDHPERDRQPVRIDSIRSGAEGQASAFLGGLEFQQRPEPEFRHRLHPGDSAWSGWSSLRILGLPDLRPGTYTLEVQGMDLLGNISETASASFRVLTPVYLRWYAWCVYALVLLIVLFLARKLSLLRYRRAESTVSRRMQLKMDVLEREKEKSDRMVAEILPEKTVAQIREQGKAKWDKYERATVLFSDIQGFTRIAEEMNPESLIDELDQFFFHFDSVVDKYNIEKIKTIGDAYMAAGGIPKKNSTNPVEVVLAALEMQAYMKDLKAKKANIWDLRIGIHTGPVIAGVVGHKKMSYDIWGDTVNTASRMESSGEPGKVNISGITYGMVKEYFLCEYRGKLPVKYKGNIDMYFVSGLRPELSVDLKGLPNKRFHTKLQILRLGDLEEKVFGEILNSLDETMHFHRASYARKVYDHTYLLCRAEEIEQEERLLTRTAALMLFTGLTQSYANHENRSAVIAREILPDYAYGETQIDQICNLILATKMPHQPGNRLEKILIDARMEYLGRPDYHERIKDLLLEMQEHGAKLNAQQFKKTQLELLYSFDYFTTAARRLREVSGEEQMAILDEERWI